MAQVKISNLPPLPAGTGSGSPKATDITPATDVTDLTEAASGTTKKYTRAQELNFTMTAFGLTTYSPVVAASTVALTATYANGSSGVGATLTNAGAQAAITLDGVTLAVGDRVLIKNQTSQLQNGIYTVTTVGTASTNWVLTRATDYDQGSEIIQGGVICVLRGVVSSGLVYQETGAGPFTIGVTSITFGQYLGGALPSTATARQMLQSGASAPPSWSTSVWPATTTINQVLYSDAANNVTGLATAPNSMLVTSTAGVPSLSRVIQPTFVDDTNGNHILGFSYVPSAVNYWDVYNAATSDAPTQRVLGIDANIGQTYAAKGTGVFTWSSMSSTPIAYYSGLNQHLTTFTFADTAVTRAVTFPDATGTVSLLQGGQVYTASAVVGPTNFATTVTYQNMATLSLTTGVWLVTYNATIFPGTTPSGVTVLGISTTSAAAPPGAGFGIGESYIGTELMTAAATGGIPCSGTKLITLGSNQDVYLCGAATWAAGTAPGFYCQMIAIPYTTTI